MTTDNDILLYGAPRRISVIHHLHAGPISMKFQDGELRYLYVGSKEIIRRIYFGVRDDRWDTVMPELSDIQIQQSDNSFKITFDAICKNDIAVYSWHGEIFGETNGDIIFKVNGAANVDFKSPRVGINILYGAESLAGQAFDLIDGNDKVTSGVFPVNVSDDLLADCCSFQTLAYTTGDGMIVSAGLDTQCIGMEDQRNYGDTSYKAFSSISYDYPIVPKGDNRSQTFTLHVKNISLEADIQDELRVIIRKPVIGARIPRLTELGTPSTNNFQTYNHEPCKYADARLITLPFNPAAHMPDDDTFMENIPVILDWVRSIRSFAPDAKFRFDPIDFESPYPRPKRDPRNTGLFAAAWCARVMKYLALGGVDEAAFAFNYGFVALILKRFSSFEGCQILGVDTYSKSPSPIDVLAVEKDDVTTVWLINISDQRQTVSLDEIDTMQRWYLINMGTTQGAAINLKHIILEPFDVLELSSM